MSSMCVCVFSQEPICDINNLQASAIRFIWKCVYVRDYTENDRSLGLSAPLWGHERGTRVWDTSVGHACPSWDWGRTEFGRRGDDDKRGFLLLWFMQGKRPLSPGLGPSWAGQEGEQERVSGGLGGVVRSLSRLSPDLEYQPESCSILKKKSLPTIQQ